MQAARCSTEYSALLCALHILVSEVPIWQHGSSHWRGHLQQHTGSPYDTVPEGMQEAQELEAVFLWLYQRPCYNVHRRVWSTGPRCNAGPRAPNVISIHVPFIFYYFVL